MKVQEQFRIEFDNRSNSVIGLLKKMGALPGKRKGPRCVFQGSKAVAIDIPARDVRPNQDLLLSDAKADGDTYISFEQHSLPLKHITREDLRDFLKGPERVVVVRKESVAERN